MLDESAKWAISDTLQQAASHPYIALNIVYFVPDARKSGGSYAEASGSIKKLEPIERLIILTDGTRIPIAQPTLGDMFQCLFSKIVLHSHRYMLELYMNVSPLGEPWSFPALQGDKPTVQLDMSELKPVEPAGRPRGQRPTMRAICMANAMKLERLLLSGSFESIRAMARALHLPHYILYRRLHMLNQAPEQIEELLFETR